MAISISSASAPSSSPSTSSSTPAGRRLAAGLQGSLGTWLLPLLGVALVLLLWNISSHTWSKNLPSPGKTWEVSKPYLVAPLVKRGELDQGIGRFAWYSLWLVAKGYAIALLVGTPLGFLLGRSKLF